MSIYLPSGYLDVPKIMKDALPFTFIVGGRGTGKTYGILKYIIENNKRFLLLRRTNSQFEILTSPAAMPFKRLNIDMGWNVQPRPVNKYMAAFYVSDEEGKPEGEPLGYAAALATFSNLRGVDLSDVDVLFYDEFIAEPSAKRIKEEGQTFLNVYETVNRNRELEGRRPLLAVCAANSMDLGNPLFMELELVATAEKMRRKGQELRRDEQRGISLYIMDRSPISDKKRGTALYKAAGGHFAEMALDNVFQDIGDNIAPQPLSEYRLVVTIGEVSIYKHKSGDRFYCTQHRSGGGPKYTASDTDRRRFIRAYSHLWRAYMQNRVYFENSTCEILFKRYFI